MLKPQKGVKADIHSMLHGIRIIRQVEISEGGERR